MAIKQLTEEQIKEINSQCPAGQGIFKEANGVPLSVKEPVIYSSFAPGANPDEYMTVLDITLSILKPNISRHQSEMVKNLIDSIDDYGEYDYYRDRSDETIIEWIPLSRLYQHLTLMD